MARVREVFSSISDPALKAVIQEEAYTRIQAQFKQALIVNPYAHSNEAADVLETMGIITNPLSIEAHTHGAAKAIENDMYSTVAHYLPKQPVTFYYMKPGKLGKFRRGPHQKDMFINSHYEPKDIVRYPEETVREHLETSVCSTSTAFMGDTLHFWNPEQLLTMFRFSPKLQTLYATMVLPAEALHQLPSLFPHVYSIKYYKDHFLYIPGSHAGASYVHHKKQLQWLTLSTFKATDIILTMQLLESKGANHLFIIQRGHYISPPIRTYGSGCPYVQIPKIFLPSKHNMTQPMPTVFAMKMFMYTKSLKDVTPRDLYAKMRQLMPDKEMEKFSPAHIIHMMNYFFLIGKLDSINCFEDTLSGNIFRQTFKPVIVWWQHFKQKILGQHDFIKLLKAVEWKPIDLTYEMQEYSMSRWRKFLHGEVLPINDGEEYELFFSKLPTPDDVNPLDNIQQETEEQLRAWDFLRNAGKPEEELKFEADPIPATPNPNPKITNALSTTEPTRANESEKGKAAAVDKPVSPTIALDTTASTSATNTESEAQEIDSGGASCFTSDHGVIIRRGPFDYSCEMSWKQYCKANFRMVDKLKNRSATLYSRNDKIKEYKYGGISHKAQQWTPELSAIAQAMEIPPDHDHCLVQFFNKKASIGFHADDEPLIKPNSAITTISIGHTELRTKLRKGLGECVSMLNGTRVYTMPPGFQEKYLHSVQALENERISLTFRTSIHAEDADLLPWRAWRKILKEVGFQADQRQINPQTGELIMPITGINKLPDMTCCIPKLNDILKKMHRHPTPFKPNQARARSFGSDTKNCRIGALTKHQPKEWLEVFARKTEMESRTVGLSVIHGTGGSGKSQALQDFIRQNKDVRLTVILPTNELRMDWIKKIPEAPLPMFKTHEKALMAPATPIVIMDDYTKLPAGFIEAYINTNAGVQTVIITGDPNQSAHHEPNDMALTSKLEPFSNIATKFSRYYLNATHRNKRDLANMLGVYSEKNGTTVVSMSSTLKDGLHLLVPSLYKKQAYGEMGHKVSTYSGCQGITADRIQILIDNDTPMCSQQVMYTALSRAVHAIHFVNTGVDNDAFWSKLRATPYLAAFLRLVKEEGAKEIKAREDEPTKEPAPATHFPVENGTTFFENMVEQTPEKYEREIFKERDGHSNCVQTEDPIVQLFPHQQAKDETLFWATIEARLKISSPEKNFEEFVSKKRIGDILFANYKIAMKLPKEPIAFDEKLWNVCADEVQKTYLSKPLHMLKNAEGRQSPDFDSKTIALFLKSQWVKKVEKMGQPRIKAGQTIASFAQEAVMLYGTMARYMRRVREVFQPPNIFINCEKTPEEMTKWARERWNFSRNSYANDYTAFDQSQDGAMLQFEILKARHHSIPEIYIQGYLDLKCCSKTFLGVLKIMRLTGEGPTFDANTECNIAFAHTKLKIPLGTAQLYAGDDCAFDYQPETKPSFKTIETEISLKSKPVIKKQIKGEWPEFCGMLITPLGIMKDPIKLWASLQLAVRTGNIKEVKESYERDLALAYQYGDQLHEIFSEEQSTAHQLTVRTIIKHGGGAVLATYN
ncbi:RNA-dependent RNA polymerase [Papaya virus X]|uniref:RNA replication protein n=1 Tax=Papaya virus X TaxID=2717302 RepID=A0A858GJL4_9VIRU|nr:RNA-dependent RNA polymerase [Papaya virus X]